MADIQQPSTLSEKRPIEKETSDGSTTPIASDKQIIEKETVEYPPSTPSTSQEVDIEQTAPPNTLGSEAPDGGLAAWLVILGVWCCSFCTYGWMNSIGIFQEYYQDHLLHGYSASTISWIPSLEVFLMTALGPFVGLIYDRHGPRLLIFVGSLLHVFGLMMASLGTKYYQLLLAQGVCSALGVSMIFQPCRSLKTSSQSQPIYLLFQLSLQQEGGSIRTEVLLMESLSQARVWEVSYFPS
jgi:hypothetical protein